MREKQVRQMQEPLHRRILIDLDVAFSPTEMDRLGTTPQ